MAIAIASRSNIRNIITTEPVRTVRFTEVPSTGVAAAVDRGVAVECPIAIEINGIGYAVMMASPADLEDFAAGFVLSERIVERAADLVDIDSHASDRGIVLRITVAQACLPRVLDRVRHRVSESSCGLCGIENLEQALRPLPMVSERPEVDHAAIFRALGALGDFQQGNRQTGSMHAAAAVGADGVIRMVREDVGRHNAFDKLIGGMARGGLGWDGGFALLSARCSYELVEKAVLANCPLLVTISAPTSLAIDRARTAGLRLIVLARSDSLLDCGD